MRVIILGGTGLTGPFIVRELYEHGHDVVVFHRGETETDVPVEVQHIHGHREQLTDFTAELTRFAPDVVVDMLPDNDRDAQAVMDVFRGIAGRIIGISSEDVYRAYDVLWHRDTGPIQAVPLAEDADLRTSFYPDGSERDKILAERVIMGDPALPGAILRYPMVYGPNDGGRILAELKSMDMGRPVIFLDRRQATWRWSRGYAENVAHASVLAVTNDHATGRIYNVAEPDALSMQEWIEKIGEVAGWHGQVVSLPADRLPAHLVGKYRWAQDWIVDTTRIREELEYDEPISPEEALRRTVAWWRNAPPETPSAMMDSAVGDEALAAEDALLETLGIGDG